MDQVTAANRAIERVAAASDLEIHFNLVAILLDDIDISCVAPGTIDNV